jgi:hypothetical protein
MIRKPDHVFRIGARAPRPLLFAGWVAVSLYLADQLAHAQAPAADDFIAQADYCNFTGLCGNGGSQAPAPRVSYDPCYLAQNALRPCTSADLKALKPHGVDANLVGTWELPVKGGLWVLDINAGGTYAFRSDAHDGVQAHAGSFAAGNGAWTMKAKTGYAGSGNYLYQAPNVFIATTQLGAVSWLRPELAQVAMHCTVEPQKTANATSLDANLVGTWQLPVKTGNWVWEIGADGTYKFHSEALDGAPSHAGVFTASKGLWSLAATSGLPGYTDSGQYLFQTPNIWMAKGKLGGAAWIRPCNR